MEIITDCRIPPNFLLFNNGNNTVIEMVGKAKHTCTEHNPCDVRKKEMSSQANEAQIIKEELSDRHPSTINILKWLIPSDAVAEDPSSVKFMVARDVYMLAKDLTMDYIAQDSPELTAGLRHLLEAKDCFIRAALNEQPGFWTDR